MRVVPKVRGVGESTIIPFNAILKIIYNLYDCTFIVNFSSSVRRDAETAARAPAVARGPPGGVMTFQTECTFLSAGISRCVGTGGEQTPLLPAVQQQQVESLT